MTETKIVLIMKLKGAGKNNAEQVVNLSRETYNYIMGTPVKTYSPKYWEKMSAKARTDIFLKEFAKGFDALSYSFAILED